MSDINNNIKENKLVRPKKLPKPMKIKESTSYKVFTVFNITFLVILSLVCFLPILQVLANSLSSDMAIRSGKVMILPITFDTEDRTYHIGINVTAYRYLISNRVFWAAFFVSIQRLVFGTLINLFMCVITAYPLSQNPKKFSMRKTYVWFFFVTMLFGGGLVPGYYIVFNTGLVDTLWSMIIPAAVPVYNVILMLNFFRQLPKELDEAAFMDGAGHWTILFKIYIPTSLPSIATIALFTLVGHWNSWFDGLLYMNTPAKYPLQTYLQVIITEQDPSTLRAMGLPEDLIKGVNKDNLLSAQIFIGAVPILCVYPFLQKYFAKGIVLGSVKG